MTEWTDISFAKYLLESLAPDLQEAGFTATAEDVEEAGHRLLHAAEIIDFERMRIKAREKQHD